MQNIYLPINSVDDFTCYVVFDSNIIRAYKEPLIIGDNVYIDFYINSHYLEKEGIQNISSTIEMPVCMNSDLITTNYYYRNDISHILVIFFILLLILFVFPYLVFRRFFGKWLKI